MTTNVEIMRIPMTSRLRALLSAPVEELVDPLGRCAVVVEALVVEALVVEALLVEMLSDIEIPGESFWLGGVHDRVRC
jgi:hypothetical protein